jgi:predicted esterase
MVRLVESAPFSRSRCSLCNEVLAPAHRIVALFVAVAGCSGQRVLLATVPTTDGSSLLVPPPPALLATGPDRAPPAEDPGESAGAPAPEPDAGVDGGLAPLTGELESLPVPGHPDAALSLPTGATARRPVVVVVHGSGDRPNWQCEGWRSVTAHFPFVVCPTGFVDHQRSRPGDTRYTHMGGAPLLAHIEAALAALAAGYPDYVDLNAPVLAGFSLGASEIVTLAVKNPARFPRIALVEGAWASWTDARIAAYAKGGGQRVLYGAGQDGVDLSQRRAAKRLNSAGIDTRVVFVPVGHSFEARLVAAVRAELPWLVEGDERWNAAQE